MIELTDEMREALDRAMPDGLPVMVGTAGASGMPDLAYKGSVMVWDAEHLAFWERAHGTTLSNLIENPNVCLLYRNPAKRASWKFFGGAELLREGALREAIMARTIPVELDRDPARTGVAVLIRVDRVIQAGKVIMERDSGGAEPAPAHTA